MTPNDIEVLMHYHASPDSHPRAHAPAVQASIRMFIAEGILKKEDSFRTTEKGEALVRMLCNTEMPQQAWVDSNGNIVWMK